MTRIHLAAIMTVLILLASSATAAPPAGFEIPINNNSRGMDNDTYVNANNILMFVTNHGNIGGDVSVFFGKRDGTYYPYVSIEYIESGLLNNTVLYSAGLWVGGKVNGQVRVTIAEYDDEFVPGPMAGGTFLPDDPSFKVYKLYRDSLASNPNSDYLNWPVDQGAPVDESGLPAMLGDQMLWAVFNDADPAQHMESNGGTDPLGLEIQQTVWALDTYDEERNVIYIKYKLYNKAANIIEDAYISLWSDPDLGDAGDDLIGCDTILDLFYCYNDGADAVYGSAPPTVGFKIVDGPVVPSPGGVADFDGVLMPGFENLPMTSFMKYVTPFGPDIAEESYNVMRGLLKDGSPLPNGTKYAVPGDPVTNTGDLDIDPADQRMIGTCGPITMMPGDSQYVLIKMAVGQGDNSLESITVMREILNTPPTTCCVLRGDVTHDDPPQINISDLVYLITYMFHDGPAPVCYEEGDLNGEGAELIDISDLTYFIDYAFLGGPPPPPCE